LETTGETATNGRHYEIFQDSRGKWWVWCEIDRCNLAYNQPTKEKALETALDMAIFSLSMYKEHRETAKAKLKLLEESFEKVFPREEDYSDSY
jgi:hypothetical protein